jgi:hypothetical protein
MTNVAVQEGPGTAGEVYVTVYVPTVDAAILITPVDALIDKPAVDEYVPPEGPVIVGKGLAALLQ